MASASIAIREPLELLTEIANTLAQDSRKRLAVWLCEGPDDKEAIEHHDADAAAFVAGNRDAVLRCAEVLAHSQGLQTPRWRRARETTWFLVDRDYHDADALPTRVNVTTHCSLEADLLAAAGARAVRALVLNIDEGEALVLMQTAIDIADSLGVLRREAHRSSLGLRLKDFPVVRVLRGGAVHWESVEVVLRERHPDDAALVSAAVATCRREAAKTGHVRLSLANGHDLARAIQTLVNEHPDSRDAVSVRTVFKTLVTTADPRLIEWLASPSDGARGLDPAKPGFTVSSG